MSASDRIIEEYAARQYGVFALRQCQRAGLTVSQIKTRLRQGAWVKLAPGVYAVASAPPKWERQVAAAVLSRPDAIVTGVTAATLLGFDGFRPGRVEIVVPPVGNARSPLAHVVRSQWFSEIGRVRADGFEVTNEPETMLVLAGRLPADRLERVLDSRLAGGTVTVDAFEPIRRRIERGRVRGSRSLLGLLDERGEAGWVPPHTELERHLDRLVDDPRVPLATRQHPFAAGAGRMIVDLYIAEWRLILEADGRRWHTRRADFERDRARDNAAAAQGLVVLRFTWQMLTQDMEGCRRTLLETGAARARIA